MDNKDEKGTPARDDRDGEDFGGQDGQAVSDQQGETAPAGADQPKDGDQEE